MRPNRIAPVVSILAAGTLLIALFGAASARIAGAPGFPLDDAWIHIRFAQNLAATGCFCFNPGEPTAGSTSPLWVVILAGASLVTREFVFTTMYLGVVSYLLLALMTYWAVRAMFDDPLPGILAALIVLVNVRVTWAALSGMETCLAGFLAVAAVSAFAAEEAARLKTEPRTRWSALSIATPVLFGLASLTRPEAHLLFALAVFVRMVRAAGWNTPVRAIVRIVPVRLVLIYGLVTAPWHLFCLWSSGSLLPNTFRANFRGLASLVYPPNFYPTYFHWLFIGDHPWVYWLVPFGLLTTLRWTRHPSRPCRRFLVEPGAFAVALAQLTSLWVIFYPVTARFILPLTRHYMRYMIPMTPFHAVLAILGLLWILESAFSLAERLFKVKPAPYPRWLAPAVWITVAVAAGASAAPGLVRWAGMHGHNTFAVNHQHVAMAQWINANVPPDAVIAAHDIGALGAISQRRIVDLFGLVTPDMIHPSETVIPTITMASSWYLQRLAAHGATHMVGYRKWLSFTYKTGDWFEIIHTETLENPDICGDAEMVAYRIHRDRLIKSLSP